MTQEQVREWWNRNPMSYDVDDPIPYAPGSQEYFRELDSRVGVAHTENSCNRAEDFLAVRRRLFRRIDENRGFIEKSRTVNSVAAGQ